jgi:hypothetical protein
MVAALFPRGTPAYRQPLWDIRYAVFAAAARAHLDGLLFTMVYRRDQEPCIARCMEIVERCGGTVCFVQVSCQRETVRQRVGGDDRKQHGKITSSEYGLSCFYRLDPHSGDERSIILVVQT